MINRRHIRIKVMQGIYAIQKSGNADLEQEQHKLFASIQKINHLYAVLMQLLLALKVAEEKQQEISKDKHLKKSSEQVNDCFVKNQVFEAIAQNKTLQVLIEQNQLDFWKDERTNILELLKEIKEHKAYKSYLSKPAVSFNDDKALVAKIFKEVVAPNQKISDFLEDKEISWTDDLPFANTMVLHSLERLKKGKTICFGAIFKDEEDKIFAKDLLNKSVLNSKNYEQLLAHKTPNWDQDRIAQIDMIIIKMAICEFLNFPSIPARVTINEYLEISKEYSTKQSNFFINGVLDKVLKEFEEQGKLQKIGRGLL